MTNRLAQLLGQLPEEQLTGSPEQRLTQDTLAARLGTVWEVVACALCELNHSGAIRVRRGRIKITNREIPDKFAQAPFTFPRD